MVRSERLHRPIARNRHRESFPLPEKVLWLGSVCALFVLALFLPPPAIADHLMKCDNKIVELGFSKAEVRARCGDPDDVTRTTRQTVVSQTQGISRPNPGGVRMQGETTIGTVITVEVERWFYNFGPRNFTRTLHFEDGTLVKIEAGSYGN